MITTLVCPSDSHPTHYFERAAHNYSASRGPTEVYDNPACSCDPRVAIVRIGAARRQGETSLVRSLALARKASYAT